MLAESKVTVKASSPWMGYKDLNVKMTSPSPLLCDTYYHIYNRGVNGETIFVEERNYMVPHKYQASSLHFKL